MGDFLIYKSKSCLKEISEFAKSKETSFEFCFGYSLLEKLILLKDRKEYIINI